MEENTFPGETGKPKTLTVTAGYGLILAVALILFSLILFLLDLSENTYVNWLSYVILIGGVIVAQLNYRKKDPGGLMSYGKAFTVGFLTVLFAAVIMSVYTYVFFKYIDPAALDRAMIIAEERMARRGMSDLEIERGMKWTEKITSPGAYAFLALFGNALLGLVISLLTSIFTRKEPIAST